MIAEAMDKVGKEGVITVEEGSGLDNELDVVEGMQFDRGYLSPYFINNQQSMQAELDDPYILLHDKKISNVRDLLPVLEGVAKAGSAAADRRRRSRRRSAGDLVVNNHPRHRQGLRGEGPGFGDRRKAMLEDIAILTGGTVISETSACRWRAATIKDLGRAKKVQVKGKHHHHRRRRRKKAIEARVKQIKAQIEEPTSDYDREKLQERVAKLAGGVAVIKVGARPKSR